jgi:hypothetical protein
LTLEELFRLLDELFGLNNFPRLYIMFIFLVISILSFIFLFRLSNRPSVVGDVALNPKVKERKVMDMLVNSLFPVSFLLLIYRVVQLFLSNDRTASVGYVASSIVAATTIMLLVLFNSKAGRERFLIVVIILFVLTGPVLEVSVLNGAKLYESTKDSVNIFLNGHWSFSYQHPIYDALPLGPVLDVFLAEILGLKDPTSAILIAISAGAIAVTTVLFVILFCHYLRFSTKIGLLTAMVICSLPYLQFTLPSSNYSFMFMIMFIVLLTKCSTDGFKRSYTVLTYITLGSAMFAHEMAILVLAIPAILLSSKHRHGVLGGRLSKIIWTGSIIFLSINLYTRALPATYSYLYAYAQGLLRNPTIASARISSFGYVPVSNQLVYLLPIALVSAYVFNLLTYFASGNHIPLRGRSPRLLMSLYAGGVLVAFLAGISLVGTVPITRHFGIFAYLCLGLGTAPIFAMLIGDGTEKGASTLAGKILIVFMILTIILGFLTPHEMPDQFSHSTAERGGILEDYALSEFLASRSLFSGKIKDIDFVAHVPYYTKYTLELALSVSLARQMTPLGMEPPKVAYRVSDVGDLDLMTSRDLDSESKVYSSQLYEVFLNVTGVP